MNAQRAHDPARIEAWLDATHAWVDREIERCLQADAGVPGRLDEAMRYAIFGGGKRLRPALVRLMCAQFGGSDACAALPAVAVECVHTYSLVHDDLPCMDDDDLRRGRPTCHKMFGDALAVLAGDALLTLAFGCLAKTSERAADMVAALAAGAGPSGMVGGQVLDLEPQGVTPTLERVAAIHARKTAAMLGASAELGAIAAGTGAGERVLARDFGIALGRCFQAIDDVLDVTGDAATLGKTPGKDARAHKPTLVLVLGLDGARAEANRLASEAWQAAQALGCKAGDLPCDLVAHLLARRS